MRRRTGPLCCQSASSCGPPGHSPGPTPPGQRAGLDLGIDDPASRKISQQKIIYLGHQVSLGLGFHFGGTRLPSDSWRWRWKCGYASVLCCFTCVPCLNVFADYLSAPLYSQTTSASVQSAEQVSMDSMPLGYPHSIASGK